MLRVDGKTTKLIMPKAHRVTYPPEQFAALVERVLAASPYALPIEQAKQVLLDRERDLKIAAAGIPRGLVEIDAKPEPDTRREPTVHTLKRK